MVIWATRSSVEIDGFTDCRNQDSLNFIGYPSLKLFQETQIVFEKQSQVINAVTQHSQTLNTHTKGKAGVLVCIYITALKYIGVHHAATHYLKPASVAADTTAFTGTVGAL